MVAVAHPPGEDTPTKLPKIASALPKSVTISSEQQEYEYTSLTPRLPDISPTTRAPRQPSQGTPTQSAASQQRSPVTRGSPSHNEHPVGGSPGHGRRASKHSSPKAQLERDAQIFRELPRPLQARYTELAALYEDSLQGMYEREPTYQELVRQHAALQAHLFELQGQARWLGMQSSTPMQGIQTGPHYYPSPPPAHADPNELPLPPALPVFYSARTDGHALRLPEKPSPRNARARAALSVASNVARNAASNQKIRSSSKTPQSPRSPRSGHDNWAKAAEALLGRQPAEAPEDMPGEETPELLVEEPAPPAGPPPSSVLEQLEALSQQLSATLLLCEGQPDPMDFSDEPPETPDDSPWEESIAEGAVAPKGEINRRVVVGHLVALSVRLDKLESDIKVHLALKIASKCLRKEQRHHRRYHSALDIQCAWRCHAARRRVHALKQERQEQWEQAARSDTMRHEAAIKIQRKYRKFRVVLLLLHSYRYWQQWRQECATILQTAARSLLSYDCYKVQLDKAAKQSLRDINRIIAGWVVRQRFQRNIPECRRLEAVKREEATCFLQRVGRGMRSRKEVAVELDRLKKILETKEQIRAVKLMQRNWRGFLTRTQGPAAGFRYVGGRIIRQQQEMFVEGFWK
mmetsp:Transcript_56498/g.100645  ORF Transcript_56498/g.100645 Transcript_56498/m.100645 type:complete len:634 (-) Transcript_56498:182-2083(-)